MRMLGQEVLTVAAGRPSPALSLPTVLSLECVDSVSMGRKQQTKLPTWFGGWYVSLPLRGNHTEVLPQAVDMAAATLAVEALCNQQGQAACSAADMQLDTAEQKQLS